VGEVMVGVVTLVAAETGVAETEEVTGVEVAKVAEETEEEEMAVLEKEVETAETEDMGELEEMGVEEEMAAVVAMLEDSAGKMVEEVRQ
jgi:hypothetical protein